MAYEKGTLVRRDLSPLAHLMRSARLAWLALAAGLLVFATLASARPPLQRIELRDMLEKHYESADVGYLCSVFSPFSADTVRGLTKRVDELNSHDDYPYRCRAFVKNGKESTTSLDTKKDFIAFISKAGVIRDTRLQL